MDTRPTPLTQRVDQARQLVGVLAAADCKYAEETKQLLVSLASQSARCSYEPDLDKASLIIFVAKPDGDPQMRAVRADADYHRYRSKAIVYSEQDNAVALCPGVYAGLPSRKSVAVGWSSPGPYVSKMRPLQTELRAGSEPIEYLYSFVGSTYTHPVRKQLLSLNDGRALICDSGSKADVERIHQPVSRDELLERQRSYDLALARSAFVLCPRGRSPASIRFYETLRSGRAPVIISDEFELPIGPNWAAFVERVPESKVGEIPDLLREREVEAAERGRLARKAWENWFAEEVIFDRIVDWAGEVHRARHDHYTSRLLRQRLLLSREHRGDTLRLFLSHRLGCSR